MTFSSSMLGKQLYLSNDLFLFPNLLTDLLTTVNYSMHQLNYIVYEVVIKMCNYLSSVVSIFFIDIYDQLQLLYHLIILLLYLLFFIGKSSLKMSDEATQFIQWYMCDKAWKQCSNDFVDGADNGENTYLSSQEVDKLENNEKKSH